MSGIVNIAGTNPIDDPDYRYKMPRIMAKVEGRGNGVKTVVVNMKEIADALHRDPGEVTKFFGCELGAQTTWKEETEKSVVNGNHSAQTLQTQIGRYIQSFVLCPSCQLPETLYRMKNGAIYQKCDACGAKNMVDMEHKLTTYILNSYKKVKKDKEDKDKKKKKEKKDKDSSSKGSKDKDGKEKKSKKDKKSKSKSSSPSGSTNGHASDSADDGHSDGDKAEGSDDEVDEEEVATADNVQIDDAAALETAIERFKQFLSTNPTSTTSEIMSELRLAGTLYGLEPKDRIFLFVGAAFGPDCVKQNAVGKYEAVLDELILSIDREAYQRHTIAVMEHLCGARYPELTKYFPVILKHLFDEELVEEDVFDDWFAGDLQTVYTRRELSPEQLGALRMAAGPFMTWLKEAEEEDDDDDEEEEDEEEGEEEA